MSCWCARLSEDERAAVETVLQVMGGEVTMVDLGKYPQVIFEPCARHQGIGMQGQNNGGEVEGAT